MKKLRSFFLSSSSSGGSLIHLSRSSLWRTQGTIGGGGGGGGGHTGGRMRADEGENTQEGT